MKSWTIRLEVADGFVWVTAFDPNGDELMSARLDDVLAVPNVIYDLPALAAERDRVGIEKAYLAVNVATLARLGRERDAMTQRELQS